MAKCALCRPVQMFPPASVFLRSAKMEIQKAEHSTDTLLKDFICMLHTVQLYLGVETYANSGNHK